MNITAAQLQTLCHIAQEAGQAIMDVYDQGTTSPPAITHKADQFPLTQADLRADRIIRDGLTRHFLIYPRFGPTSQWDTAAAHAVLQVAGGSVCNLNGAALCYGLQQAVLNPHFVATATFATH